VTGGGSLAGHGEGVCRVRQQAGPCLALALLRIRHQADAHYLGHSYGRTAAHHCALHAAYYYGSTRSGPSMAVLASGVATTRTAVVFYRRNMMLAGLLGLGPGAYSCK
jgi:hypothetical protein